MRLNAQFFHPLAHYPHGPFDGALVLGLVEPAADARGVGQRQVAYAVFYLGGADHGGKRGHFAEEKSESPACPRAELYRA